VLYARVAKQIIQSPCGHKPIWFVHDYGLVPLEVAERRRRRRRRRRDGESLKRQKNRKHIMKRKQRVAGVLVLKRKVV
jgi:hypothetical protein